MAQSVAVPLAASAALSALCPPLLETPETLQKISGRGWKATPEESAGRAERSSLTEFSQPHLLRKRRAAAGEKSFKM